MSAYSLPRLLWHYVRPQWRFVALLLILLSGSITLQLAGPQVVRAFIDATTAATPPEHLRFLAVLYIGVAVVQQVLAVLATYYSERTGWAATNALREDVLSHCLKLDLTFHKARTPGELIERIDGDVTALANFFSQFVVQIGGNAVFLTGVAVLLWTVDWRAGLLMSVFALGTVTTMHRLRGLTVPHWRRAREASADLYGFIEERLGGTVDLRANGAAAYTVRRLHAPLRQRVLANCRARVIGILNWGPADLLSSLQLAATFVLMYILFRDGVITIGTAVMINFYTWLSFRPLSEIRRQLEDFQKAGAGLIRVQDLLAERSALAEPDLPVLLPHGSLSVEFEHVTFDYETAEKRLSEPVLHDVSFTLSPSQVLGLLGRTGSGKTTISRLLFRLYDVTEGSIRLGGVDVRAARRDDVRTRVGMVTQDVQLFRASVRDNVSFFDRSIPEACIYEALESLGLADWCRALPQGLETVLGATAGVSAGEAQLLAFTRVFLKNPGLVILDEASSRLDPATERLIERAIARLLVGRTAIIIAHRLATVQRADTIMVMEAGRIVEFGPRTALAADPASRFASLLSIGLEAQEQPVPVPA